MQGLLRAVPKLPGSAAVAAGQAKKVHRRRTFGGPPAAWKPWAAMAALPASPARCHAGTERGACKAGGG